MHNNYKMKNRPLMISEFIGPLSGTYTTPLDEYQAFKVFSIIRFTKKSHSMIKLREKQNAEKRN